MASPLIAPFKTGLNTDQEPWLIPPDGFSLIDNIHLQHGYIEKRGGFANFGSLSSGDRVMGIFQYIDNTNARTTYAFDTDYPYRFDSASNDFVQFSTLRFTGGENDYFVGVNWQASSASASVANRLYVSNGLTADDYVNPTTDGIQFINSSSASDTSFLVPRLNTSGTNEYLGGGKLIFSIGQRLVVLNTIEGTTSPGSSFPQRARWCAKLNPAAWEDDVAGAGGFTDAATGEHIISAQLLQNQIVVFFTNSVWSLVPTADPNRAFRWERINDFRACFGKNSSISYDRYAASIGDRGIVATDGSESRRMDDQIQDFVVNEINVDQFSKVYSARDYQNRRAWTLYPDKSNTEINKALIYDEETNSYSTYTISLNCLGYGNKGLDYSFDDFSVANDLDYAFDDFEDDETFLSFFAQESANPFLGGDISGNIYILNTTTSDNGTEIQSEFFSAAWNPFNEEGKECVMPYIDVYVQSDPTTVATIEFYKDTDDDPYQIRTMDFLPPLDFVAQIVNVTQANPANVNAPSHGLSDGDIVYIYGVRGMAVNSGEAANSYTVTVVDKNSFTIGVDSSAFSAYTGGGGVYKKEFYRTKTWKRIYGGGTGFQHRIRFISSGLNSPFTIHALKPMFKPRGRRLID